MRTATIVMLALGLALPATRLAAGEAFNPQTLPESVFLLSEAKANGKPGVTYFFDLKQKLHFASREAARSYYQSLIKTNRANAVVPVFTSKAAAESFIKTLPEAQGAKVSPVLFGREVAREISTHYLAVVVDPKNEADAWTVSGFPASRDIIEAQPAAAPSLQPAQAPPVANPALRDELLRRREQDQAIRNEMIAKGSDKPDAALSARMRAIDEDNTKRMQEIIKQYDWPGPELVGSDATFAAWLLVQHADLEFQKQTLPLVREAYLAKKLPGSCYALLLDRVLVRDGKPQIYGTQARSFNEWKDHVPVLEPIEDEANVDKRRAEVGLPPIADYIRSLKETYFPNDKSP